MDLGIAVAIAILSGAVAQLAAEWFGKSLPVASRRLAALAFACAVLVISWRAGLGDAWRSVVAQWRAPQSTQVSSKNAEYSVLIFHKPAQREVGMRMKEALAAAGFRSMATATELREAAKQFPPDHAWIIYTNKGQQSLDAVKQALSFTAATITYTYQDKPDRWNRGDVQVLLF